MQLPVMLVLLTLNNEIIEARSVPAKNLEIEGYLEGLKKDMLEEHEEIIDLRNAKPEFKIQDFITDSIVTPPRYR